MESLAKYRYSLVAGSFAAAGSFFGKLPSHLSAQKLLNTSQINDAFPYLGKIVISSNKQNVYKFIKFYFIY